MNAEKARLDEKHQKLLFHLNDSNFLSSKVVPHAYAGNVNDPAKNMNIFVNSEEIRASCHRVADYIIGNHVVAFGDGTDFFDQTILELHGVYKNITFITDADYLKIRVNQHVMKSNQVPINEDKSEDKHKEETNNQYHDDVLMESEGEKDPTSSYKEKEQLSSVTEKSKSIVTPPKKVSYSLLLDRCEFVLIHILYFLIIF